MDFLYISPEFPPNYANFILQLHNLGIRVWGIGEADFHVMPEQVRAALHWYTRANLHEVHDVTNGIDHLLAVKAASGSPGMFDVVESHNEQWLSLEAFINTTYGIAGITLENLERIKKKSVMKGVFRDHGLSVARGARIQNATQALNLVAEWQYPVILKPDEGVGAGGIYRVDDESQLTSRLSELHGDYLMEEFIAAPMVTYDGLTDTNGEVVFASSLTYGEGVLEYVQGKDPFFYVSRRIPDRLATIGKTLTKAFDIRRKFFHFEFFCRDGDYVPIEVNCRPPGGPILDMMNYSMDADLYHAYARMMVHAGVELPRNKAYYCCYLGRRDKDYVHSHAAICSRFGTQLVEYGENPPLFREAMGKYRYILRSEEEADMHRIADYVLSTR